MWPILSKKCKLFLLIHRHISYIDSGNNVGEDCMSAVVSKLWEEELAFSTGSEKRTGREQRTAQ